MYEPWPAWAIFPVLGTILMPAFLIAEAIIWHEKRAFAAKCAIEAKRARDASLLFCPDCDEWMYASDCDGDPKYCGRRDKSMTDAAQAGEAGK